MPYEKLEMLIAGEFRAGSDGRTEPVINPATEEVIGEVPYASAADLDAALQASAEGFKVWRARTALQRQAVLEKAARLMEDRIASIAETLTLEMGKPFNEAKAELQFVIDVTRWYGEEGKRAYGRLVPPRMAGLRQMVTKEPVGPCCAFVAWNFPGVNVIRKVAGALGAGCSIVIKPSEETPGTAVAIARCFQDAGLPAGVLNVVFGIPDEVSRHVLGSWIPRKVSFTGSIPVGKHLLKLSADTLKRATMELGGHAPVIVFDDADVNHALNMMAGFKYRNAGQVCISPTRFFVHEKAYDKFVGKFVDLAKAIPADKYEWRPGAGVRSVGEVLLHVASDNYLIPAAIGFPADPATGIKGDDYKTAQAFEQRKLSKDQAVAELGKGMVVEAVSTLDGLVEAIRWTGDAYARGVQWHPELLVWKAPQQRLFSALASAAAEADVALPRALAAL